MRIYCDLCDKVQPAQVDDCKDVKTGELYQDIVCGECNLVITSGTGIKRQWVGLTEDEKVEIRREHYARTLPLMEAVEAKLKEKNS